MNEVHWSILDALKPCEHFNDVCKNHCTWAPEKGHIPRGFGGGTARVEDVRLIIVTAEPGDPADGEFYDGSPEEMIIKHLKYFDDAMRNGLARRGRQTPFHRNMKELIDLFWPNDTFDAQMSKTWFTDAVLCSAKIQGGKVPQTVEDACAKKYLWAQVKLMPRALTLALGSKAKSRMLRNQIRIDLSGDHPSPRDLNKARKTWAHAANRFHELLASNSS